ncbi:Vacuolar-sorting protein SNF7 [Cytospora mali]|uniref:Vacuolar-sorting protein SNF7 n=1 Tax=Cytospora mali TaxID=578113 RepID=A0A194V3P5_CYTMA|nr:Vacuolar-sorting protein SNF7 [Valsa mali var. pyri (nom. inval.)]
MSGWGLGWFGGGSTQKQKNAPKNAILALRSQLDMLQKRERHLQNQMDEQDGIARKFVTTNNKNAAKTALKRKKQHEHSLEQTQAQIGTLEQQINAIESANINRETLLAMEKASEAMKQIHGKLTPEKVDETMDKLREQTALSDEIINAITSNQIGDPIDEDELEDELADLQQSALDEQMLKTGTVPVSDQIQRVPAAPQDIKGKTPVAAQEDDEEEELRKLQAEMAM